MTTVLVAGIDEIKRKRYLLEAPLVRKIILAKRDYYNGTPTISDSEYDIVERELKMVTPYHPVLLLVGYSDDYLWYIDLYSTIIKLIKQVEESKL
jgi:hypothetical protein